MTEDARTTLHVKELSKQLGYNFRVVLRTTRLFGVCNCGLTRGMLHIVMATHAQKEMIALAIASGDKRTISKIGRSNRTDLYIMTMTNRFATAAVRNHSARLGITTNAFRARMVVGRTDIFSLRKPEPRKTRRVVRTSSGRPPKPIYFGGFFATKRTWLNIIDRSRSWLHQLAKKKNCVQNECLLNYLQVGLGPDWKPKPGDSRFFKTIEEFEASL